MIVSTEAIQRDLNQLDDEQLQQVVNFIAFLRFQGKYRRIELHPDQLSTLATEFAEEDRALAEAGIGSYADALDREGRL